jgi:hypothetical protein
VKSDSYSTSAATRDLWGTTRGEEETAKLLFAEFWVVQKQNLVLYCRSDAKM